MKICIKQQKTKKSNYFFFLITIKHIIDIRGEEAESISENHNSFGFSLYSLFCPQLSKKSAYQSAMKFLNEYMDIKNIIKRLQDVDKLKMLFLNEHQRIVFEMIPKPGVGGHIVERKKSLTVESMLISKKELKKKNLKKIHLPPDGDPLNKKILEMLSPEIRKQLECIFLLSKIFFLQFKVSPNGSNLDTSKVPLIKDVQPGVLLKKPCKFNKNLKKVNY